MMNLDEATARFQGDYARRAIGLFGTRTEAARRIGITREGMWRLLKRTEHFYIERAGMPSAAALAVPRNEAGPTSGENGASPQGGF